MVINGYHKGHSFPPFPHKASEDTVALKQHFQNTYILGVGLLYIKTNRRQEEKSKVVKLTPQVLQIAPLYSSFRICDQ